MKILVLNCGSSSIKYKLFDMDTRAIMAQGGVEKIGLPDSFLQVKLPDGKKVKIEQSMPEHTVGIQLILNSLIDKEIGCLQSLEEINAVGHRVVHGGEKFNQSVLITPEVKEMIVKCIGLAGAVGIVSTVSAIFNAAGRLGLSAMGDKMKDRNTVYKIIFIASIVFTGLVIATGGGCVTREENYPLLHQNGILFWLQRDLEKLPTDGRPLSQKSRLEEMFQVRQPLYRSFADHIIDNNGSPDDTILHISEVE